MEQKDQEMRQLQLKLKLETPLQKENLLLRNRIMTNLTKEAQEGAKDKEKELHHF